MWGKKQIEWRNSEITKKKGKKSQNVKTTSKSIKIQIEMGQNGGMQERVLFKKNQAWENQPLY